ncbi:hypothetical protein GCM10009775_19770 [Microbacterium aoyamense]|uniref:Uncharacterized protein n=1 Tax=Microbacterium aoyamense TaxID=344166 RepID=A0ABN2PP93_9MICO|nr:hypothetical protein [Microbacterium aoyamense]
MTRLAIARRLALVALTATAAFGLAACTSSSTPSPEPTSVSSDAAGDDGQSVEDACALVQGTITEVTSGFEDLGEGADPAAVVDSVQAASQKIGEVSSQITNDEVAAIVPSLQDMFAQVGETMTAIVEGDVSKLDDLSALGESFQTTTQRFQEVCAP